MRISQRKRAAQIAYKFYSNCTVTRTVHSLFGEVKTGMETILFKSKFADWPLKSGNQPKSNIAAALNEKLRKDKLKRRAVEHKDPHSIGSFIH